MYPLKNGYMMCVLTNKAMSVLIIKQGPFVLLGVLINTQRPGVWRTL